ncbi:SMC family ATPase [Streptomyces sp. NBC_01474]|uniref:SMC family ATPase n=1 Tax=Streptomyces sp. NBC_01474 TaxID=2903880 RepID=UPI002DDB8D3E|nr:SMC family ATPase [Streptomyces sp. NBC_01474]WSD92760.1 SMC family ATPase [Streptomyces sp. NBC_01474]WSE01295.1 SMC family ATPase [Streptomyces sp. NBC_01474]
MKPLTLTLTGFRSYPGQVTVDFTGTSLVGVVGDTGAGKSSLLDGISYALFRKSSWSATKPGQLIADGAQAMSVDLTFLHEGQRWHVHRTMHATNPNAGRHHLKNLDTGEETDNANHVDDRLEAVLQMSYETFLRVGLLPQGKFDQLLIAAPKERGKLLRELFGAESLETIQRTAARQRETLNSLLAVAKTKREAMPDDPAQAADEAGAAAAQAETRAEHLNAAVGRITQLQKESSTAQAATAGATAAAHMLFARSVSDAGTTLEALEPVAADIAARREALNIQATRAAEQESGLTDAIAAADAEGEGQDALSKAAVILEALAADAEEHRGERDRLAQQNEQLTDEDEAITRTEEELVERAAQIEPSAHKARAAAQTAKHVRQQAAAARTHLAAALTAAGRLADAVRGQSAAASQHQAARGRCGEMQEAHASAEGNRDAARTSVETLQQRDQAAAIGADLHDGDDCPICLRQLPDGFEPAPGSDAAELAEARTQLTHANRAQENAADQLARARAAVTAAETAIRERDTDHDTAQQTARETEAKAKSAFSDLATTAAAGHFDDAAAMAALTAVTTARATPAADGSAHHEELLEQDIAPITDALTACEHAAETEAEQLQADVHHRTARIDTDRATLNERKKSHQRAVEGHQTALSAHTRAVAKTTRALAALPPRIRATLPGDAIEVTADAASTALDAVAARQTALQELFDQRESARQEKNAVLSRQRALDEETRTDVDRPLSELRGNLDAWAQAVTDAVTYLDAAEACPAPQTPAAPGIPATCQFAAELATATATLNDKLAEHADAAAQRAAAATASLREQTSALAEVDGFDPTTDLTAADALHPLVTAAAQAGMEATDQRHKQQTAQDMIKPAADLDFAVTAGTARAKALDVLRRELVDAKFLAHLTMLRTRALRDVASDLLGQMSDDRFGFADNFDIISRTSGVNHHPNRLSGGEKFQASLALALALAELHSRSGSSLGSLFLDEGFAALDSAALDSALDVLRARAGGDRLVMVISHLHAVAEAVDAVLWVERGATGSSTRWLTPAERDDLVQADLASGLQTLTQ